MLTHERLKEVLNYNSETGLFFWKRKIKNICEGKPAGAHHNKGYIQLTIDCKNYLAHRVAWFYVYKEWPKDQIDHINRNKKDNRIANLRDVNNSTNQINIGTRSHNSSGVTGVVRSSKKHKPWAAQLHRNNKKIFLGYFDTVEKAEQQIEKFKLMNP